MSANHESLRFRSLRAVGSWELIVVVVLHNIHLIWPSPITLPGIKILVVGECTGDLYRSFVQTALGFGCQLIFFYRYFVGNFFVSPARSVGPVPHKSR